MSIDTVLMAMRCVVCGVGNRLRADDSFGPVVADELRQKTAENNDVLVLDCGSAPENFLSKIKDFGAEKVVIVDAVELSRASGTVEVVDVHRIRGFLHSTHQLPLSLFIGYLLKDAASEVVFVGVQPKVTEFGEEMSDECREAVDEAVGVVLGIVGNS